jgi:hypothetical protein
MDNFQMQPIRLIPLPIHCQKSNPFLVIGIQGILGSGSNPLCQMRNLAILGLINLPSGCPRLIPSSVLPREDYTVAVVGDIELFGTTVRGNRTIGSQTCKFIIKKPFMVSIGELRVLGSKVVSVYVKSSCYRKMWEILSVNHWSQCLTNNLD